MNLKELEIGKSAIVTVVGGDGALRQHFLYKRVLFKGEAVPFVMELPNYRIPSPKSVARLLWEKARDFIQKAAWFCFNCHLLVTALAAGRNKKLVAGTGNRYIK